MHNLIGIYLFCGLAYAAWTWRTSPDRKFDGFASYLKFVALITFLWWLFAARDIVLGLYRFVFGEKVELK